MNWDRDLPSWPLNHLSRRRVVGTHRWHIQETGEGDTLLLLHGAGASTHSWRDVIPHLARRFHVVAIDLPGQGFTQVSNSRRSGLQAMSHDIHALCDDQNWTPSAIIGHSAGAAIALELSTALPGPSGKAPAVIGINPALGRFEGVAGWLFPLLAKFLALNPLTSYLFSAGGRNTSRARRLIKGTGSDLTDEGIGYYARLISTREHVEGTLQMMAQWHIDDLLDRLDSIDSRCLFIVGGRDKAVKPEIARRAAATLARADLIEFPYLGHLAHEEKPYEIAQRIEQWLVAQ